MFVKDINNISLNKSALEKDVLAIFGTDWKKCVKKKSKFNQIVFVFTSLQEYVISPLIFFC